MKDNIYELMGDIIRISIFDKESIDQNGMDANLAFQSSLLDKYQIKNCPVDSW